MRLNQDRLRLWTLDDELEEVSSNPCDDCHFLQHPPVGCSQLPQSYAETPNPYGEAYLDAGRDEAAVRAIASLDSDGDSHPNSAEIAGATAST